MAVQLPLRAATPESCHRVVLLVGGLGTRLRGRLPPGESKVTALIAGHPALAFQLAFLRLNNCTRVHLALSHQADRVLEVARRYCPPDTSLSWHVEAVPEGTGGAVRTAFRQCGWRSGLVVNGDSFCLEPFDTIARASTPASHLAGFMLVIRVGDASRFGAVDVDGSLVRRFLEKKLTGPGCINAGVYWFDESALAALPTGTPRSLERDLLPGLAARGQLGAVICDAPFHDIGTPDSLTAAEHFLRSHWISAVRKSAPFYVSRGTVEARWAEAIADFPPRF